MKLSKIEEVMYLVRMNLFDYNADFGDWRESEVVQIVNGDVTLRHEDGREQTWSLDELEKLCRELCHQHFEELEGFLKELKK